VVKEGHDVEPVLVDAVVQAVGKLSERYATYVAIDDWPNGGVLGKENENCINCTAEPFAQAQSFAFVPVVGSLNIGGCLWPKGWAESHFVGLRRA
jgi:hypothetical protein